MQKVVSLIAKGFTFIEVILVVVISSLAVSLVTPRLVSGFKSVEASLEEQRLVDAFDSISHIAFLRKKPYVVKMKGRNMHVPGTQFELHFAYISFPATSVRYNANGYPDKERISYRLRSATKQHELL